MGLNVGDLPVKLVYVGSTLVKAVYVGSEKIWPTTDVVQIMLGTGYEARDQLRAALSVRGLAYQTVTEIPFDIELVGAGSARNMFYGCASLTYVPDMDASDVTGMGSMFQNCSALTTVPPMDTSSVMYMNGMFRGCSALTTVPPMDTSSVTDMSYMFEDCSALTHVPDLETAQVTNMNYMFRYCSALADGNARLIGRHPNVTTMYMIAVSGLTREPFYDAASNPI